MPALPFCHVTLRAQKTRDPAYPRELKTLGDHLRKRRLDFGLLQREVAKSLGVRVKTLRNWERGKTAPQRRFLPRSFGFLGADPKLIR
jgi:DNA-binding transcriptional regulator YiaG